MALVYSRCCILSPTPSHRDLLSSQTDQSFIVLTINLSKSPSSCLEKACPSCLWPHAKGPLSIFWFWHLLFKATLEAKRAQAERRKGLSKTWIQCVWGEAGWCKPVIPALGKLRRSCNFGTSLGYALRHFLNKQTNIPRAQPLIGEQGFLSWHSQ